VLLLVSVRSAMEVGAALSGGADIIDAKEPTRGPLGPVSLPVLREILGAVPSHAAVSVALGDLTSPKQVASALGLLDLPDRPAPIYLKIGCGGIGSAEQLEDVITTAIDVAQRDLRSSRIIAVGYADAARTGSPSPAVVCQVSARAGAAGVLLDTAIKDGRNLFHWMDSVILADWIASAREAGLLAAVAGGLGIEDMSVISATQPDVVGVRSGACDGGRMGNVNAARVRALRSRLDSGSASLQGTKDPMCGSGGETRDPGANSSLSTAPKSLSFND
jgi:uncharacterized protein (UPF0264 family)